MKKRIIPRRVVIAVSENDFTKEGRIKKIYLNGKPVLVPQGARVTKDGRIIR